MAAPAVPEAFALADKPLRTAAHALNETAVGQAGSAVVLLPADRAIAEWPT